MNHPSDKNEIQCPLARAAFLIGKRWTLEILRDLSLHKTRRYQDFQNSLDGISPNTLSERLKELENAGIIFRQSYQDHPPRSQYVLTQKGQDLGPVLSAVHAWGKKYL